MGLLYVDTWINQQQTKSAMVDSGATHNFITEAEARRLRLRWDKDLGRMKAVNFVTLLIVGLVKRTTIKRESRPRGTTIRGNPAWGIGKARGDKDTLCVPEKCHDVLPNSWPKSVLIRRTIDHGIELLPEAKTSAKNVYRMASPELAKLQKPSKMLLNTGFRRPVQALYGVHVLPLKKKDRNPQQCIDCCIQSKLAVRRKCPLLMLTRQVDRPREVKYLPKSDSRPRYYRVRTTKAKGLEITCATGHEAYEFPVVPLSLTDATGGKCCSVQSQMNMLGHAAFNGSKQAMIKRPSLGVVDATKTPKVEAEQFNCVLEEYLHHCVDGRQKNWVQMLKVAQFGHRAQTDSLIKRSLFEIKGKSHSVLPPLADGPYVGDRPQAHRVGEEWEQMADIARVCLEEASRPMEERVDQKRCPLEFELISKLSINGATTPYDYLSTWTWRKIEK
ncbi:reverse transcriptase [Cucumis melo var. makuwa]|uniref:Reverse transcriptase n=1 Tax=Cucumis melo var. makuwa TaxID=1194695 RepID=A0A5A7UQB2_CUCMM|nr:reverse transcriptase [Cucumis melo var. makuwa]